MALMYSHTRDLGWQPPDFSLQGTDVKDHSPQEFADKKALLIIFTCNHCPYAIAAWPLIIDLHQKYRQHLGIIAINANDPQTYPDDSFDNMIKKAQELNLPFPYVIDTTQGIARAFDAQCTPDPYLFKRHNDTWQLFYHGRINDNWQQPDQVTDKDLESAINLLLEDKPAPEEQPPSMGCSIKWKGDL